MPQADFTCKMGILGIDDSSDMASEKWDVTILQMTLDPPKWALEMEADKF